MAEFVQKFQAKRSSQEVDLSEFAISNLFGVNNGFGTPEN
jgi:hypothetical protein